MEWEIGTLGRGKYRLSLFRIAEGETLCEVLESGTAYACVILSGDLDVSRPGGRTSLTSSGNVATMTGPGTYCLHANQDTLGLRGSIHTETTCNPPPAGTSIGSGARPLALAPAAFTRVVLSPFALGADSPFDFAPTIRATMAAFSLPPSSRPNARQISFSRSQGRSTSSGSACPWLRAVRRAAPSAGDRARSRRGGR